MEEKIKSIRLTTMQKIALGFFGVILIGGVLLWLPICNTKPIAFIDALFTSVTAVCVTGLVTITPATQFTLIGKLILLLLIQIGGLGVLACTMGFMIILKRQITVRTRVMIQEAYNMDSLSGMVRFMLRVIKGTFFVEGVGAILYATTFVPKYGWVRGVWYSVFHAISAFCNAGIDILDSDSLTPYVTNPVINFTTMFLIVAGGLGFIVWYEAGENFRKTVKNHLPITRIFTRLTIHARIVIIMTVLLLTFGTVVIFALEYRNPETIANLSLGQKVMASMFQSVTLRTAGFATISQSGMMPATKFFNCILMVIGGSPGGTAGGIKTTTVALLLLTCISEIRGKGKTECMGARIAVPVVRTAIVITMITVAFLFVGVMGITILEPGKNFLDILYEGSSAIGTVGLTADLTSSLSRGSHIILMIMMYVGRIGPITMALVLGGKNDKMANLVDLPVKRVMVG